MFIEQMNRKQMYDQKVIAPLGVCAKLSLVQHIFSNKTKQSMEIDIDESCLIMAA